MPHFENLFVVKFLCNSFYKQLMKDEAQSVSSNTVEIAVFAPDKAMNINSSGATSKRATVVVREEGGRKRKIDVKRRAQTSGECLVVVELLLLALLLLLGVGFFILPAFLPSFSAKGGQQQQQQGSQFLTAAPSDDLLRRIERAKKREESACVFRTAVDALVYGPPVRGSDFSLTSTTPLLQALLHSRCISKVFLALPQRSGSTDHAQADDVNVLLGMHVAEEAVEKLEVVAVGADVVGESSYGLLVETFFTRALIATIQQGKRKLQKQNGLLVLSHAAIPTALRLQREGNFTFDGVAVASVGEGEGRFDLDLWLHQLVAADDSDEIHESVAPIDVRSCRAITALTDGSVSYLSNGGARVERSTTTGELFIVDADRGYWATAETGTKRIRKDEGSVVFPLSTCFYLPPAAIREKGEEPIQEEDSSRRIGRTGVLRFGLLDTLRRSLGTMGQMVPMEGTKQLMAEVSSTWRMLAAAANERGREEKEQQAPHNTILRAITNWLKESDKELCAFGCGGHQLRQLLSPTLLDLPPSVAVVPSSSFRYTDAMLKRLTSNSSRLFNEILSHNCARWSNDPLFEWIALNRNTAASKSQMHFSSFLEVVATDAAVMVPTALHDSPLSFYIAQQQQKDCLSSFSSMHHYEKILAEGSLLTPSLFGHFPLGEAKWASGNVRTRGSGDDDADEEEEMMRIKRAALNAAADGKRIGTLKSYPLLDSADVAWVSYCCGCCGFSNEIASFIAPLAQLMLKLRSNLHQGPVACHCNGMPPVVFGALARATAARDPAIAAAAAHRNEHSGKTTQRESSEFLYQRLTEEKLKGQLQSKRRALLSFISASSISERGGKASFGEKIGRGIGFAAPIAVSVLHTDPASAFLFEWPEDAPEYVVYRSMSEFSKIPSSWVVELNSHSDAVWVPSSYVRDSFISSGVDERKIKLLPEPIDTELFDPSPEKMIAPVPLPLPPTSMWRHCSIGTDPPLIGGGKKRFVFLSNFKWEPRKGAEILLEAYAKSFTSMDPVSLVITTNIYEPTWDWQTGGGGEKKRPIDLRSPALLREAVMEMLKSSFNISGPNKKQMMSERIRQLPHIQVITEKLSEVDMVRLYKGADAFVLPTRGEGWGLPVAQAMAMALPTIATNHSGIVDFLSGDSVGFLIPVERLEEVGDGLGYAIAPGAKWAVPSVTKLGEILKFVFKNRQEAKGRGVAARKRIVAEFSVVAVRRRLVELMAEVAEEVAGRRRAAAAANSSSSLDGIGHYFDHLYSKLKARRRR